MKPAEKREHILNFREQTKRRIDELEHKKLWGHISRAETFELDMCLADFKRATRALDECKDPKPIKKTLK